MRFTALILAAFIVLCMSGSAFAITIFYEDFSNGLPADWAKVKFSGSGGWKDDNPAGRTGPVAGGTWNLITGPLMIADSLYFSTSIFYTILVSPDIDCTDFNNVHVAFDNEYYRAVSVGHASVAATATGIQYSTVETWTSDTPETTSVLDISGRVDGAALGGVLFEYKTDGNINVGYWAVDNVQFVGSCNSATEESFIEDSNNTSTYGITADAYSVTCYTPTSYPSFIKEFTVKLKDVSNVGQWYGAVFVDLDGNGPDGDPIWVSEAMPAVDSSWNTADLSGEPLFHDYAITQGAWCVGVYDDSGDGSGPLIYFEEPQENSNDYWGPPGSFTPTNFDWYIRATVEDCPDYCACYIDDECYADGDLNPDADCQQCDPANAIDAWTDSDLLCADGAWCNGDEVCNAGTCVSGTAPDCDDSVGCTDDSCDEANDACVNTVNNANCDDGDWCNGAETCDATNDCQAGTSVDCDDAVACTDDSCDEANDTCVNAVNDANCDDGAWCNGAETCDATNDCEAGTAPDCDDAVGCTDDSCDETNDVCVNIADDSNCGDGDWCNGAETCDATNDCQAGTAIDCDDGVGCTDDSCDELMDACVNDVDDANCDDGAWCNGAETCDATNDCEAGTDQCDPLTETCDEANDVCDPLADDDDDDDDVIDDDDDDDATDDDSASSGDDDDDSSGCCG
jgi:hypothetical protein